MLVKSENLCCAMLLTLVTLVGLATPATAEWRRADTPRFVVYSDGDTGQLRDAALQLELYESALRLLHQLDPNGAPKHRIAIYLVGDHAALTAVEPGLPDDVAGFYQATNDEIFALAVRERRDQSTLLHEYAHHFMIGSFATGFPSWFVEGYAEYFASAQLQPRRMVIGEVNRGRGDWLAYGQWLPLQTILTRRPFEFQDPKAVSMYYAQSWLLTHWFLSNPARTPILYAYIDKLRTGMDPVEAMEAASGMTLAQLDRQQREYARQRMAIKIITGDQFPQPDVRVTTLSAAEDSLLLLSLKLSSTPEKDPALLEEIRRRTAPFPDDRFAQLLLSRAELRQGDKAVARSLLEQRLAASPDDVDVLRLLGETLWEQARDDPDGMALVRDSRRYLAKAYQIAPDDYRTLMLLAETRQVAPNYPTDNDVETLLAGLELAPQVATLRVMAAQARARREEYDEAIDLLQPLAASPHASGATSMARHLIAQYRARLAGEEPATGSDAAAVEPAAE
jgi:tetratricopeptide (TPR) repeat protein